MRSKLAFLFCLVAHGGLSTQVQAEDPIQTTIRLQAKIDSAAARSQQRIDQVSDETKQLLRQYRRLTGELESLRAYDAHLERMVSAQEQSITSLEEQLDAVQVTHRDVIPLMARMVDTLEQFVALDLPFLLDERRRRIGQLKSLLDRPDTTVAEKYRRVMEAYQIETEYGRTIEAYRGTLRFGEEKRTVEFLRVGRIGLLYRSLDGKQVGAWNPTTRSWQALSDDYRTPLKQALRVARKQAAPELLTLPVPAPRALQ